MGTLAKRLGQLTARSLESESSNIIKTGLANKTGLSKSLDTTLRTSHDMKVFGLGTAASMANRERYARFTTSMYAVYSSMERELDAQTSPANCIVWNRFGDQLRRTAKLQSDLEEVGAWPVSDVSPASERYAEAIVSASRSDAELNGGRLLGHVYCRYFADLFGGQALAGPYQWALGLEVGPTHYDFGDFGKHRRQSIETIYEALNEAGEVLGSDEARGSVVAEARRAFSLNVDVYKEEGALVQDGIKGLANVAVGYVGRHR